MLNGETVDVVVDARVIRVNEATVGTGTTATNGVIHEIDKLLMPPGGPEPPTTPPKPPDPVTTLDTDRPPITPDTTTSTTSTTTTIPVDDRVIVPDVVGMNPNAARTKIQDAGLKPESLSEPICPVPEDNVTRQDPTVGTRVDRGTPVKFYIC